MGPWVLACQLPKDLQCQTCRTTGLPRLQKNRNKTVIASLMPGSSLSLASSGVAGRTQMRNANPFPFEDGRLSGTGPKHRSADLAPEPT